MHHSFRRILLEQNSFLGVSLPSTCNGVELCLWPLFGVQLLAVSVESLFLCALVFFFFPLVLWCILPFLFRRISIRNWYHTHNY